MRKELSIIIPVFNEEKILQELYTRLTASAQQVTDNYELIFVNDGSKDSSLEQLIAFSKQDLHVFYFNFSR